jgi:signal transduction histidine kinase
MPQRPDCRSLACRVFVAMLAASSTAGLVVAIAVVAIYQTILSQMGEADARVVFASAAPFVLLVAIACVFVCAFVALRVSRGVASAATASDTVPSCPYETPAEPCGSPVGGQEDCGDPERRLDALREANEMRRTFTTNVTHELKTPISSIQAAAELIRDGVAKTDDVPEFAGRICEDAKSLSILVNDILMLSALDDDEQGDGDPVFGSKELIDLANLTRDVCERSRDKAVEAQVDVRVTGTPELISGNARLLAVLVDNLYDNALRYNHPGGWVTLDVFSRDGHPCLEVRDSGDGIPADEQDRVFERFYRIDKGRSRGRGGAGLGLALVKHVAVYHGATVTLKSAGGEGTCVTVTFEPPVVA